MTPELLKKLDHNKMYSWDEVMDISTTISTMVVVELMTNKEARDKIIMEMFVGKPIDREPNSRRRKKQTNK